MTNEPSKYLSFSSGNPTKKRHIIFNCPLTQKYKYGKDHNKDRIDGTQDHRNRVRIVCGWAMKDGQIKDQQTFNDEIEYGYKCIKEAELEKRNEIQLNPEWVEWKENKPQKKTKTKEPKEHTENRYTMLEQQIKELNQKNKELTEQNDELKEQNFSLTEETDDLNYQLEHEYISMDEYNEIVDKNDELNELNQQLVKDIKECGFNEGVNEKELEQQLKDTNDRKEYYKKLYNDLLEQTKPKEKKKKVPPNNTGKKYKTKNKEIDNVIDELVDELDNEPIDL
tara:strand:+ start:148 stop:990 length:843 start_codon:yes stop_codon:yes gene_type:complete